MNNSLLYLCFLPMATTATARGGSNEPANDADKAQRADESSQKAEDKADEAKQKAEDAADKAKDKADEAKEKMDKE